MRAQIFDECESLDSRLQFALWQRNQEGQPPSVDVDDPNLPNTLDDAPNREIWKRFKLIAIEDATLEEAPFDELRRRFKQIEGISLPDAPGVHPLLEFGTPFACLVVDDDVLRSFANVELQERAYQDEEDLEGKADDPQAIEYTDGEPEEVDPDSLKIKMVDVGFNPNEPDLNYPDFPGWIQADADMLWDLYIGLSTSEMARISRKPHSGHGRWVYDGL